MDVERPPSRTAFRHERLDHDKPSIRLVQLLPELSHDGLIQCNIIHTTIDVSYQCLSYRWGEPSPSGVVLINHRTCEVRQNLLDFLSMARANENAPDICWIDALCIDQMDTAERNHQVAQMGQIYSHATCVHIWLGANGAVAPILRTFSNIELQHHENFDASLHGSTAELKSSWVR